VRVDRIDAELEMGTRECSLLTLAAILLSLSDTNSRSEPGICDNSSLTQGPVKEGFSNLTTLGMRLLWPVRGSENGEPADHFTYARPPVRCSLA